MQLGRVEELGSGIRNITQYLSHYTPGAKAHFIEEDVFRTIIPVALPDGINEGDRKNVTVNVTVKEVLERKLVSEVSALVKERLVELLIWVGKGKYNVIDLVQLMNLHRRTIHRYLLLLRDTGLVDFEGTPKTGNYRWTPKFESLVREQK